MTDSRPAPGDSRPRTLPNPPGDRYAEPAARRAREGQGSAPALRPVAPNRLRVLLFGLPTALGIAVLYAILVGILDLGIGLLALAAVGGWAIGFATRTGAWAGNPGLGGARVRLGAIALAAAAWFTGYFGAYLLAVLLRPDSSLTFGERLAQSPFLDWLSPQFGVLQVLELLLIVGFAWYGARPRAVTMEAAAE